MTWLGARGSAFGTFALADGLSSFALTALLLSLGFALSASAPIILVHVRQIEVSLLVAVTLFGLIVYRLQKLRRTNLLLANPPDTARGIDCTSTGEHNP